MSRMLPITRRGLFSEDDFFKDFQSEYSSAVTDVLDRWGGRSLLADQFTNYRKARQAEPQDDSSLAASISETPDSYVIVLDMTDFVSGEITVRTRGYNAVVDAKVGSERKFHRSYPLPRSTNVDTVVAAMSDEGILTINVKKKQNQSAKKIEATCSIDEQVPKEATGLMSKLKIDVGSTDEISDNSGSLQDNDSNKSEPSGPEKQLTISKKGHFFKDAFFENVWNDFDSAMEEMVAKQKQRQEKKEEERKNREAARRQVLESMMKEEEEQRRKMRAEKLEKQRKASQEMQEQLRMFQMPAVDRLSSYRSLRNWTGAGEDSQAATITADANSYKVVLDVKDYAEGNLDLKCDGEKLIVCGSKGGMSFKREFSLRVLTSPEKVTASMSADGVLTITAPRAV